MMPESATLVIERLRNVEHTACKEQGPLALFGLSLREDYAFLGRWDIVAAAPWADADRTEAIRYLADLVQESFPPDEMRHFSHVTVVPSDAEEVVLLAERPPDADGTQTLRNETLFGHRIDTAYVLTARRAANDVCA